MSDWENWPGTYKRQWNRTKLRSEARSTPVRDEYLLVLNMVTHVSSSEANRKPQRAFY